LGIHACVCGEIYPSLAPESISPRRTGEPESYVYGHLNDENTATVTFKIWGATDHDICATLNTAITD